MDTSVYERSNSSYRSRWFCIAKKEADAIHPVHSLEPLNTVTIQHSGVTPFTEQITKQFAGRSCRGMLDLYIRYDERALAKTSHDYTTFQTPYGALRLTKLPMGWTNAVPIFHDDVTHILQLEVPQYTIPYINDVPIRGPTLPSHRRHLRDNPRKQRHSLLHLGAFPKPQPDSAAYEVLWGDVLR